MNTAEAWGRIYAVIDRVAVDGLKPHETNAAAETPGVLFGHHCARIQRRLPGWADMRLRDLLDNISPDDMGERLDIEAQGKFFLGFYHEKTRLEGEAQKALAGRPPKDSPDAVNWSTVDWSMSNAEIARDKGVTRQAVAGARKRCAQKE